MSDNVPRNDGPSLPPIPGGGLPPGMPPVPTKAKQQSVPEEDSPIIWLPGDQIFSDSILKIIEPSALMVPPLFPIDGRFAKLETVRRVTKHFQDQLGAPKFLIHRLANDGLPLEQIVFQPPTESDIPTIVVTAGLSDLALPGPYPYRELVMVLPSNFPLGQGTNQNPLHSWPYTILRKIACYSVVSKKTVWEGNLLPWEFPIYPGARFQDLFVIGFSPFDLYKMNRDYLVQLQVNPGNKSGQIDANNTVFMHRLLPILPDEAKYLRESGPENFSARLMDSGVPWDDLERPSCLAAAKSRLPSNLPPIPPVSRAAVPVVTATAPPIADTPTWHKNIDVQSAGFAALFNANYAKPETIQFLVENTRHFGSPVHLFHPGRTSKYLKMEILVFQPPNRPTVLLTAGFSDYAFDLPFRMEYAIVLPPGWPIDELSLKQPQFDWPFKTLGAAALYAVMEKKLIQLGQTFDPQWPAQYYPGKFKMWFMYFMNPPLPERPGSPPIVFLQPIPIYQEEFVYRYKSGDKKFVDILEKEFPEIDPAVGRTAFFDFNRKNVAPKERGWWPF